MSNRPHENCYCVICAKRLESALADMTAARDLWKDAFDFACKECTELRAKNDALRGKIPSEKVSIEEGSALINEAFDHAEEYIKELDCEHDEKFSQVHMRRAFATGFIECSNKRSAAK